MSLLPNKKVEKVSFFKTRLTNWEDNAVAIGTSTVAVSALSALVTAAETAIEAQSLKAAEAKLAVESADVAVEEMMRAGADIISAIRTKGRTGGQTVYDLALIPAPATPSPKGKPGTPTDYNIELNPDGSIRITWKCSNPVGSTGTIYQVFRATGATVSDEDFAYLGGSGQRKFVDGTIPAGATVMTYKIQAVRSTSIGDAGTLVVAFGSNASGAATAKIIEAPKLAA